MISTGLNYDIFKLFLISKNTESLQEQREDLVNQLDLLKDENQSLKTIIKRLESKL